VKCGFIFDSFQRIKNPGTHGGQRKMDTAGVHLLSKVTISLNFRICKFCNVRQLFSIKDKLNFFLLSLK